MKSNSPLLYFFALTFILSSCHSKSDKDATGAKPGGPLGNIEGTIARKKIVEQSIQVSGTLLPMDETVLMTEVAGRVVNVNLPEGKFVPKGTLLVKLFDGDLQAQLNKLQVQLKIAETTQKRQEELLKINGISQLDYDNTVLTRDNIKADIEILKVNISKTEIRAPYNGVIGLRKVSAGAFLTTTAGTAVATIRAEQQLKLDFSVPEKYGNTIDVGREVSFTIQGDSTKYKAKVIASERSVDNATRNLKVRALVTGKTTNLVAGAFADVNLKMGENNMALMVPTQCVIPQARDKKVIVSRGGKATFVKVKTGIREVSTIEIVDGIQEGDTIVATGLLFIRPDQNLKFSKITDGTAIHVPDSVSHH